MAIFGDIMSTATKGYLYSNLAKDIGRFLRRNFSDVELDRDYWLHKAGLSTYTPMKSTFGAVSVFGLGLVAGGIMGLALAPKAGVELREEVKDRALNFLNNKQQEMSRERSANA